MTPQEIGKTKNIGCVSACGVRLMAQDGRMSNVAAESLEQFIGRRLQEVSAEVDALRGQLDVLLLEKQKLEVAANAAATIGRIVPGGQDSDGSAAGITRRSGPVAAEKTIKQAVVEILREQGRGMTALEILPAINARLGVDYPRTSLSPQLSRLRSDDVLVRLNGNVWALSEWTQKQETSPDGHPKEVSRSGEEDASLENADQSDDGLFG